MKNNLVKILSLVLCVELVLAPFPKTAAFADNTKAEEVATPEEFVMNAMEDIKSVQKCSNFDSNGIPHFNNTTTAGDIHHTDSDPGTELCREHLQQLKPEFDKLEDMVKEAKKAAKSSSSNGSCATCNVHTGATPAPEDPENSVCSKADKEARAKERKTNASCSFEGNLKNALTGKNGPTKSAIMNVALLQYTAMPKCLWDMASSLFDSYKALWTSAKALASKVKSYFDRNKAVEKASSDRALVASGMSDKEIADAKKDPQKATESMMKRFAKSIESVMEWTLENVVGADIKRYKEEWKCAPCDKRLDSVCRIMGVVGKDVINNAILWVLGGKAIEGIGALVVKGGRVLLKGSEVAGKIGTSLLERAGENAAGHVVIEWGSKKFASLSTKTLDMLEKTLANKQVKAMIEASKWSAEKLMKGVEHVDNVVNYPTKLLVEGGKSATIAAKDGAARLKSLLTTPDVGEKIAKDVAKNAAENATEKVAADAAPLIVESNRIPTEAQKKADAYFQKQKGSSGARLNEPELVNVTAVEHIDNPNGSGVIVSDHYIRVSEPEKVTRVHQIGTDEKPSFLIEKNDNSISYAKYVDDGKGNSVLKVEKKFAAKEAKNIRPLIDPQEIAKSDELLKAQTELNAKMNGMNVEKDGAIHLDGEGCPKNASISVGTLAR